MSHAQRHSLFVSRSIRPDVPSHNLFTPPIYRFAALLKLLTILLVPLTLLATGCTKLDVQKKTGLHWPQASNDSVTLEVFFVRFPLGDAEMNGPLWTTIDEQHVPGDVRRKLAANGFRVGVLGNSLPPSLEKLLNVPAETPLQPGDENLVDLQENSRVRRRMLQVRGGHRSNIIATGEREPHAEMHLLVRGDDDHLSGHTYKQVKGQFAMKAFPQGDGRVRLELIPEIEHGEPQRRFIPGDGLLKVEFGPACEVLDNLRIEASLTPGQMLVLGSLPDRPGSVGHQFFTEQVSGPIQQKLVIVRLTQSKHDDLFSTESPVVANE